MVGDGRLNLHLAIQTTISTNCGCNDVWESYYQPVSSCSMIALWCCNLVISEQNARMFFISFNSLFQLWLLSGSTTKCYFNPERGDVCNSKWRAKDVKHSVMILRFFILFFILTFIEVNLLLRWTTWRCMAVLDVCFMCCCLCCWLQQLTACLLVEI